MFLQAAGMATHTVRELEARLDKAAGLTPQQRTLVQVAEKATRSPHTVTAAERIAFLQAAGNEGNFVEAAGIIAMFNFITRIADALGVDLEIPKPLRRFQFTHRLGMSLVARVMRIGIDLRPREITAANAASNLSRLDRLFTEKLGFAYPLPLFERLAVRPYLLEAHARMAEVFFTQGELPVSTIAQVGVLVAGLTGDADVFQASIEWLKRNHADVEPVLHLIDGKKEHGLDARQATVLQFARDMTLHAYKVTDEQVEELRNQGLRDEQILDLAGVTALCNAQSRLHLLLGPTAQDQDTAAYENPPALRAAPLLQRGDGGI